MELEQKSAQPCQTAGSHAPVSLRQEQKRGRGGKSKKKKKLGTHTLPQ